jgi:hypothetical protein
MNKTHKTYVYYVASLNEMVVLSKAPPRKRVEMELHIGPFNFTGLFYIGKL